MAALQSARFVRLGPELQAGGKPEPDEAERDREAERQPQAGEEPEADEVARGVCRILCPKFTKHNHGQVQIFRLTRPSVSPDDRERERTERDQESATARAARTCL